MKLVAGICEAERADVLVIAGDLFSDHAAVTVERMTEELNHLYDCFRDFFGRGGTVLAVTGNHDRDARVEMIRAGMRLGSLPPAGGALRPGRMYLQNGPGVCVLGSGDDRVQFVLVPYPQYPRYAQPGDSYGSREEQNRLVQGRVAEWVQNTHARPGFDPTLPSVLVAHLHVRGAEVHTLYKLSERDDVLFEAGFVPSHWAYAALGHIHKPQCLGGATHVRYPGPLDRLDFAERDAERGVIAVEVGRHCGPAGRSEPRWVPLPPTPMHVIRVCNEADFTALTDHPEREAALVQLTVAHGCGPSRDEVARTLGSLFPRHAEIVFEPPAAASQESPRAGVRAQTDYRATVRGYLAGELAADDPDRDDLLDLAETFLSTPEAAP